MGWPIGSNSQCVQRACGRYEGGWVVSRYIMNSNIDPKTSLLRGALSEFVVPYF